MNFGLAVHALARRGYRRAIPRRSRMTSQAPLRAKQPSAAASPAISPYSAGPVRSPRKAPTSTQSSAVAVNGQRRDSHPRCGVRRLHDARRRPAVVHRQPRARWTWVWAFTASRGVRAMRCPPPPSSPTTLVDGVLTEKPTGADSDRIAVILNGLGRTKYEELFVVWKTVRGCSPRSGLHRGRPGGRRAGHQPRHGRLLAYRDVARRRTRTAVDLTGRYARLSQGADAAVSRKGEANRR